ncbi:unnamed protein product [Bursaphelenchus okinawaensis]|uniref:Uncharacterized protein n=1 Tax=Bursaphelenchus okinawaensis TaxID=465554 RepID=A0A811LGJ3_9BILA|nr:unnamed protein product [Bursaphelenchus okinawaensis]CAG9123443.1 unnamed protein product [Bursaphelenchus okinawaensis]
MCYHDKIYRLKGETWATAFSLTSSRAFNLCGKRVVNCRHSGNILFHLGPHHVILAHIDFANFKFEFIDFSQYFEDEVSDIILINNGTRMIVKCGNFFDHTAYLYDIAAQKIIRRFRTDDFSTRICSEPITSTILYDPYSDIEFELPQNTISISCMNTSYDKHRYLAFWSWSKELYLQDTKTDYFFKLCRITDTVFSHYIFEDIGHVFITSDSYGPQYHIYFYDIKSQVKVYERSYIGDRNFWHVFSSNSIINTNTEELIVYNVQKKQFFSSFINYQHSLSPNVNPQEDCNFITSSSADGRRLKCYKHRGQIRTFLCNFNKDRLRLMTMCTNETSSVDKLCHRTSKLLNEPREVSRDSINLADEATKSFLTNLQLLLTRPSVPEVTRVNYFSQQLTETFSHVLH